jgi:Neuraminidase (sialidase)
VWQSNENLGGVAGSDEDIFVARSTDNGASWTAPATLNTNATTDSGDDFAPTIATDGLGNWVVAWRSDENLGGVAGTDDDLFVARSVDNGVTWTPPFFLNSDATTDAENDGSPSLTTDALGHWVVVWRSNIGGNIAGLDPEIYVARSADNGANWSAPALLNTNADDDGADLFPQVATDGVGNWIALWVSASDLGVGAGPDPEIFVARSTDNGVTWTDPALLNTNAIGDSGTDAFPQLAADGAGNWVAVWQSDEDLVGAGSTDQDIFVARSANDGTSWTAPALLNSNAASDSGHDGAPQVTTDGLGNWVAVWWSMEDLDDAAGTDADILAAYSTDNGATWTDPALLNTNGTSDTGTDLAPQVTTNGLGNWIAVWESSEDLEDAGTDQDIFTAQFIHPHVTLGRPNGGEQIRQSRRARIEWARTGDSGERVRIHLLRNDRKFRTIRKSTPNDGSLRWKVRASKFPIGDDFKVRVTPIDFPAAKDSSDNAFSIVSP